MKISSNGIYIEYEIEENLYKEAMTLAGRQNRPMDALVNDALRQFLAARKKPRLVKEQPKQPKESKYET
jgi:hypothetical protein